MKFLKRNLFGSPNLHSSVYLPKHPELKRLAPFLLALLPLFAIGQGRKYSNAFLDIGIDARGSAMSRAVIASTKDVTSAYWNPAGIFHVREGWQGAAMHAEYFAGLAQYDYIGFAKPIDDQSSIAVSVIRFGADNILNTTQLIDEGGNIDYDRISKFSAADYALIGTYARQSAKVKGLNYGGNVKIIYRQIGKFASAIGFGFDLGAQYKVSNWEFGANLRDVTSTFNAWNIPTEELEDVFQRTGNELPDENLELTLPSLLIGAGRQFNLGEKYTLRSELSAEFTFGGRENTLVSADFGNINPNLGIELGYLNFIFVRAGAGSVQRGRDFEGNTYYKVQPNMGIGLKYKGIYIDYALTNIANATDVLYSNLFSLKFNFAEFKSS